MIFTQNDIGILLIYATIAVVAITISCFDSIDKRKKQAK